MKKNYSLLLVFFCVSSLLMAQDKVIADVKRSGSEINVLDESGKRIGGMNAPGKLVGVGIDFFVIAYDGFLTSYNYRCDKLGGLSSSNSKVKVINNTITVTHDGGEVKYDRNFKRKY